MAKLATLVGGVFLVSLAAACPSSDSAAAAVPEVVTAPSGDFGPGRELVFRAPDGARLAPEECQRAADAIYERVYHLVPPTVGVIANEAEILVRVAEPPTEDQVAAYRARVEHAGSLRFARTIETGPLKERSEAEREAMLAWRGANPAGTPEDFGAVSPLFGGPGANVRWFAFRGQPDSWIACDISAWLDPSSDFSERDLDWRSLEATTDRSGFPALAVEIRRERAGAFGRYTEQIAKGDGQLAILDGEREVLSAPVVTCRLEGPFIIEGRLKAEEAAVWVDVWRSGARVGGLPFRPEFVVVR
jgi:hypothetical protein